MKFLLEQKLMLWVGLIIIACTCLERHCLVAEEFEVTIVFSTLSAMPTIVAATIIFWVG